MDRLLRVPEIAEMTGKPIDTIRWYRHTGAGPKMFKLGRHVVAKESDVAAWIEAQYVKAAGPDAAA